MQSSHSLTDYDIAWVSSIAKPVNGEHRWAFPKSFQFLLEEQEADGGWDDQHKSNEGILNALATLVAIERHEKCNYIHRRTDRWSRSKHSFLKGCYISTTEATVTGRGSQRGCWLWNLGTHALIDVGAGRNKWSFDFLKSKT